MLATGAAPARAQSGEPTADESAVDLAALATQLGSDESEARVAAFDALRTLPASELDAIEARLRHIRLNDKPGAALAYNMLTAIRHEMGAQRADAPVDIAIGTRRMLTGRAPRDTLRQVAERVALLRSLEAMGTRDSTNLMVAFYQRRWRVWQWEARHAVGRLGLRMLPALIEGRRTVNRQVHRWAIGSIRRVGVHTPGEAVQQAPIEVLPDVLKAYARISDLRAMPVVISFVDHPDPTVRAAARWGAEQYGQNAIWELRKAYRNKLGEAPPAGAGWEPTMRRLFEGIDTRRLQPANDLLDEGLARAEAGDLDGMNERFSAALRREPLLPRRDEMAPPIARAAAANAEAGEVDEALREFRRAIRLAPEHADAPLWRGQVAFLEAERANRAGVLDLAGYEEAAAADPTLTVAREVVEDVEAGGDGEVSRAPDRAELALGMALLGALLLGWSFLRRVARFVMLLVGTRAKRFVEARRNEARDAQYAEDNDAIALGAVSGEATRDDLTADGMDDARYADANRQGAGQGERRRSLLPRISLPRPSLPDGLLTHARVAKRTIEQLRKKSAGAAENRTDAPPTSTTSAAAAARKAAVSAVSATGAGQAGGSKVDVHAPTAISSASIALPTETSGSASAPATHRADRADHADDVATPTRGARMAALARSAVAKTRARGGVALRPTRDHGNMADRASGKAKAEPGKRKAPRTSPLAGVARRVERWSTMSKLMFREEPPTPLPVPGGHRRPAVTSEPASEAVSESESERTAMTPMTPMTPMNDELERYTPSAFLDAGVSETRRSSRPPPHKPAPASVLPPAPAALAEPPAPSALATPAVPSANGKNAKNGAQLPAPEASGAREASDARPALRVPQSAPPIGLDALLFGAPAPDALANESGESGPDGAGDEDGPILDTARLSDLDLESDADASLEALLFGGDTSPGLIEAPDTLPG